MTNLITEGFDWFPAGKTDSQRKTLWGANTMYLVDGTPDNLVPNVTTGRFDFGKAYYMSVSHGGNPNTVNRRGYIIPTGEDVESGFVGFGYYRGQSTYGQIHPGVGIFDAVTGSMQGYIEFAEYGVIKVWRGSPQQSSSSIIATSSPGSFEEDEWFHCEFKYGIGVTDGFCEVRINTATKIDLIDANTRYTSRDVWDSVFLGNEPESVGFSMSCAYAIDDLFVNSTSGSVMNDWAGNLRVKGAFMVGDGATNDFSIGGSSPASTNWQSVLNQNLDDTKYVYSPNVGDIDLYELDPIINSPIVRVVQVRMGLRQDDATQRSAKAVIRIGGINYEDDVEHFTNQSYTFYKGRWELNPDTGVSFTGTEVNGLEPGIKVES